MFRSYFVVAIAVVIVVASSTRSVDAAYADQCTTPTGQQGQCVPYSSCTDIELRLQAAGSGGEQLTPDYIKYLRQASCGEIGGIRNFCCAASQIQHNSKVISQFRNESFECGKVLNTLVANGKEVRISSRPWMALLKYKQNGGDRFLCGGTLISDRYILTAAHCIYGLEEELFEVRLGEHQISTEKDCRLYGRKEKCAPPVQDVGIEKQILHEHYDPKRVANDIALLRLSRSVQFERHIKPICLPITKELKQQAEEISGFFVTGWGTTEKGSSSDVLLQAAVPLKPRTTCSQAYARDVPKTQLCVGGADYQDSCKGDSGGPLQAAAFYLDEFKVRMVEFGIVSLGVVSCGEISLPALYTNVAEYVQWITDQMALNGL
ncbi:serine protease grass [Scaptodrosophila lebanonensis]|uniref:CLIP domain-containing serine protease n=1 Tax=Drosophila lebanonensis TaxID=7225 RepID=A0A6J2T3B2_DROLE|nr:serine protease grass [Scaptodrosophila lebanonensis]